MALVMLIFCIGVIASMWRILKKSDEEGFNQKYGALRETDYLTSKIGLYWKVLINIRWVATIVILVALRGSFASQLLILLVISTLFQALHLYISRVTVPFANEVAVSIYIYLLMALASTDEIQARNMLGWALVGVVGGAVGLNALQAVITDGRWLSLRVRLSHRVKAWWQYSRNTTVQLLPLAASPYPK